MAGRRGSVCDVVGCSSPGTGSYLNAAPSSATEFALCDAHFARMAAGETPVIVAERLDLAGLNGRQVLIFD